MGGAAIGCCWEGSECDEYWWFWGVAYGEMWLLEGEAALWNWLNFWAAETAGGEIACEYGALLYGLDDC